jgi:hypothetical protein
MTSDPTFETREALEAWADRKASSIGPSNALRMYRRADATRALIMRVTLAHARLLKEPNDD